MCLWTEAPILCSETDPSTDENICNEEVGTQRTQEQPCKAFITAQMRTEFPLEFDGDWDRTTSCSKGSTREGGQEYGCVMTTVDGRYREKGLPVRTEKLCSFHQQLRPQQDASEGSDISEQRGEVDYQIPLDPVPPPSSNLTTADSTSTAARDFVFPLPRLPTDAERAYSGRTQMNDSTDMSIVSAAETLASIAASAESTQPERSRRDFNLPPWRRHRRSGQEAPIYPNLRDLFGPSSANQPRNNQF